MRSTTGRGIPFILREADEMQSHTTIDVLALPAFTTMAPDALRSLLGKGDTFISQDLQSATLFGDYRVDGAVINVAGYNDYALNHRPRKCLGYRTPHEVFYGLELTPLTLGNRALRT